MYSCIKVVRFFLCVAPENAPKSRKNENQLKIEILTKIGRKLAKFNGKRCYFLMDSDIPEVSEFFIFEPESRTSFALGG